jgi:hypothetical protein
MTQVSEELALLLTLAWVALVYFVCGEWMCVFAKGEFCAEVHTGHALKTCWLRSIATKDTRGGGDAE